MRRTWLTLLAVAALPLTRGGGQEEGPVPLPPFIVEEATKGPPWRYAQIPGFEILARCSDRSTRSLAEAHYRLHALLGLLVPESLQLTFAAPKVVIYYDEALQGAASKEVMESMVREQEKRQPQTSLQPEPGFRFGGRGGSGLAVGTSRYNFIPNLRLTDKDAMTVFAIVRDGGFDGDKLVLTRDYLSYLVVERTPTLPAWYAAGVLGLYDGMEFEFGALRFGPLAWVAPEEVTALKQTPAGPSPLRPLAQFLTKALPSLTEPDAGPRRERWRVQATLFVRWALDGRTPAQRAAFFEMVEQAAVEPITPADFQRCFGLDFATADIRLAEYLAGGARKAMTLKPERPIKLPKISLRDADEGEVSRVKGDWERLEVAFVQKRSPELAPKYLEQARRTLLRAYERGDRSAGLLANLGLCECDAGNDEPAGEYLEAAARRGPLRARANYELARLRLARLERSPEGAGGKLSTTQMVEVLTPLFAARAAPPPFPEIYELIAKVWALGSVGPTRGHLAVLDEGARLFPRRVPLLYQLAQLHAQRGDAEDAANLVALGLYLATDAADRERFTQLQARLAPALDGKAR